MRIAVVGSGYVGLVTGACFADLGHEAVLVDNDEQKLAALRNSEVPIHERFLPELLGRHRGKRIRFSGDLQAATRECEAVFIAVGTPPTETGDADLSYVESVAREISGAVDGYKVVVEKSTVPVYTSQWIRTIILRNGAGLGAFDVASNPEFLREGTAVTDFLFPDRIVVGVESQRCAEVLRTIYEPLTSGAYYGRADASSASGPGRGAPRLRPGNASSHALIVPMLRRLVPRLQSAFPGVKIKLRGHAGFALPLLYQFREFFGTEYAFGIPANWLSLESRSSRISPRSRTWMLRKGMLGMRNPVFISASRMVSSLLVELQPGERLPHFPWQ